MQSATILMEEGTFDEALEDVSRACNLLTAISNPELTRGELRLCVAYNLALRMLLKLKEVEMRPGQEKAVAFICAYPPKHN